MELFQASEPVGADVCIQERAQIWRHAVACAALASACEMAPAAVALARSCACHAAADAVWLTCAAISTSS